ncbi:DUF2752 domain-containing protein [Mucilaginibacter polytrichastri]|uniref:DUF2752 domain-containing protein n=1 Tax=Mucilaginibacter polytrichastri TaxID=1302689 RepID=A0A1Q6A4R1_9SPHI|nr:DUF2752 domain-containing protein [Mucilaginibacter polytrichastri]OKS88983.1 hypothetical protein RG47T_4461 [Mucilaginibacter polytrichastri]
MIKKVQANFELIFWIMAIMALGLCNPATGSHFTLCPLKLLGFGWCPGCGIGHAITYLLHGDTGKSFKAHWLGLPALAIILYRICNLIYLQTSKFKKIKPL